MNIVEELVAVLGYEIKGERNLKKFQKSIDVAATKIQGLSNRIVQYSAIADRAFNASRTMAIPSAAAIFYTRQIVEASKKTEGWQQAFEAITGSAKKANEEIAFAADVAERYGASVLAVTDGWKQFAAATKGTAVEGNAREIFQTFTSLSTRLGQTPDQLKGILLALEQMVSKGKVSAEELRGQLGERLPGAFQAAAKAMGVTTQELDKMLQKGEVVADEMLPKMAKVLRDTYKFKVDENIDSNIAKLQRMHNALFNLKNAIADSGLIDFLVDLAQGLTTLVNKLNEAPPFVQKLVASFILLTAASAPLLFIFGSIARSIAIVLKMASAIRLLGASIGILSVATRGGSFFRFLSSFRKNKGAIKIIRLLAKAFTYLRFALLALLSPIGLIVSALAAIGLIAQDVWTYLNGGISVTGKIIDKLKGFKILEKVSGYFDNAKNKVKGFAEGMWNSFSTNFPKTAKALTTLSKNIIAIGSSIAGIIGNRIGSSIDSLTKSFDYFKLLALDVIITIKSAWSELADTISNSGVMKAFTRITSGASSLFKKGLDTVLSGSLNGSVDATTALKNLTGNLDRTSSGRVSNSILNSSNAQTVNNNINVQQNVSQATDAPAQVAKDTGRALSRTLNQRAQLEVSPAF